MVKIGGFVGGIFSILSSHFSLSLSYLPAGNA